MKQLELNNLYSREDVHEIFSPETNFTPGAGYWGLQGIVRVPKKQADFIFFVTYGRSWGGHKFNEGISTDGVLSWQSQPKQNFKSKVIQTLINHDETKSNIYLFLRENKKDNYRYLGKLKYLDHDKRKEHPVYFQWQLLDFKSLKAKNELTPIALSMEQSKINLVHTKEDSKKNAGYKEKIHTFLKKSDSFVGVMLVLLFGPWVMIIIPGLDQILGVKVALMGLVFLIWISIIIYRKQLLKK